MIYRLIISTIVLFSCLGRSSLKRLFKELNNLCIYTLFNLYLTSLNPYEAFETVGRQPLQGKACHCTGEEVVVAV